MSLIMLCNLHRHSGRTVFIVFLWTALSMHKMFWWLRSSFSSYSPSPHPGWFAFFVSSWLACMGDERQTKRLPAMCSLKQPFIVLMLLQGPGPVISVYSLIWRMWRYLPFCDGTVAVFQYYCGCYCLVRVAICHFVHYFQTWWTISAFYSSVLAKDLPEFSYSSVSWQHR